MRKVLVILMLLSALTLNASTLYSTSRGGAVLTSTESRTAFSGGNPASLADNGFFLEVPISLSIGHVGDIASSGLLEHMGAGVDEIINNSLEVLRSFSGEMELLDLKVGLDTVIAGFALSLEVEALVDTQSGSVGIGLIPAIGGRFSWGYGRSWELDGARLSAGFLHHIHLEDRCPALDVDTLVDLFMNPSKIEDFNTEATFDTRVDIGLNVDTEAGFTTALVARVDRETATFDAAMGWHGGFSSLPLSFELGMRRLNLTSTVVDLMKNFNASASLGLTKFVTISGGLSGGYPSVGLELKALCFSISAAYWWKDYGIVYGLAPRDNLGIEISLIFD